MRHAALHSTWIFLGLLDMAFIIHRPDVKSSCMLMFTFITLQPDII